MNESSANFAEFPATLDELARICDRVREAARASGMSEGNLWKLETSVDEACTNIVCYGYCGKKDGKLWIRWRKENDSFLVTIEDAGIPFDQTQPTIPDFSNDICRRQVGGLGRYIMRELLDDMVYQRKQNRNSLTLIKNLSLDKKKNPDALKSSPESLC
ncbi:MAG: ATP-binding protein, partial [bacterium]